MANILSRIFTPRQKAAEGEVREGPYQLPIDRRPASGWLALELVAVWG